MNWKGIIATCGISLVVPATAVVFTEAEANDTTETANVFTGVTAGDQITGISTGSSTITAGSTSSDNFRLAMAANSLGIYRHRLQVTTTGTAGHSLSIRGYSQAAGVINTASNLAFQTSSTGTTPSRFIQWYGFGKAENVDVRLTGTTATTAGYVATLSTDVVTPTAISQTFNTGTIRFSTVGTGTDTALLILDSNLSPIPGYFNDDSWADFPTNTVTTTSSVLERTFSAGTYYIAVARWNMNSNLAGPTDERTNTDNVLRTPGFLAASSSSTASANSSVTLSQVGSSSFTWTNSVSGAYEINFARFEVVPEPATMTALGLGVAAMLRRRRKSS